MSPRAALDPDAVALAASAEPGFYWVRLAALDNNRSSMWAVCQRTSDGFWRTHGEGWCGPLDSLDSLRVVEVGSRIISPGPAQ